MSGLFNAPLWAFILESACEIAFPIGISFFIIFHQFTIINMIKVRQMLGDLFKWDITSLLLFNTNFYSVE
jgi:hypothetical protein